MDAARQDLFDHPGVCPHHIFIGAIGRQRADDCRRAVSTPCLARIDKPAHEFSQPDGIEGAVLELHHQVVGPSITVRRPVLIGQTTVDAAVVDWLSGFQQLDRSVYARHSDSLALVWISVSPTA